jgi:proline iminopeptidase
MVHSKREYTYSAELRYTMVRYKIKKSVFLLAIFGVLFALGTWQYAVRWGSTKPFLDPSGARIVDSVAEMRRLELGGVVQSITVRGKNTNAPILIWLHGGPGQDETGMLRRYNSVLEEHFVVVYWTQRGTGRSYNSDIPSSSMTIGQFVSDLNELIIYSQQRFGKQKVVLAGHSWGTSFGVAYTQKHPEKVATFVSIGQVVNAAAAETLSYKFTLEKAKALGNKEAIAELSAIGPPPYPLASILVQRKWLEEFGGGSFRKPTSLISAMWQSLSADEVTLFDGINFQAGANFSQFALEKENSKVDWWTNATEFEMPIFLFTGRYDNNTPASLQAAWYHRLSAPHKKQIWFENSAHSPLFEEANAFNRFMIEEVLPVAQKWRSADR